ncbi:SHOCT domain-containing protein [Micropruina sp.]|uniref:SHOCT domain-containing protein n=1 Tax=Micropruina sp. TaxID=2737536 RepID=UPI002633BDFE|nr:SHOCT domain-containing protein [Micropruina sp.]
MGLFKTAAKVAVASSVHGRVQRRQAERWAAKDQAAAAAAQPVTQAAPQPVAQVPPSPPTAQQPVAAPAPPAAPAEDPMQRKIALLTQLGELRTAGVLTDAEFEAQKAVILAG